MQCEAFPSCPFTQSSSCWGLGLRIEIIAYSWVTSVIVTVRQEDVPHLIFRHMNFYDENLHVLDHLLRGQVLYTPSSPNQKTPFLGWWGCMQKGGIKFLLLGPSRYAPPPLSLNTSHGQETMYHGHKWGEKGIVHHFSLDLS